MTSKKCNELCKHFLVVYPEGEAMPQGIRMRLRDLERAVNGVNDTDAALFKDRFSVYNELYGDAPPEDVVEASESILKLLVDDNKAFTIPSSNFKGSCVCKYCLSGGGKGMYKPLAWHQTRLLLHTVLKCHHTPTHVRLAFAKQVWTNKSSASGQGDDIKKAIERGSKGMVDCTW